MTEADLIAAAKRYLKEQYAEDAVAMTVTRNGVKDGSGVLAADCTVRIGGETSDWSKRFTFTRGRITDMSARRR